MFAASQRNMTPTVFFSRTEDKTPTIENDQVMTCTTGEIALHILYEYSGTVVLLLT